MDHPKLNPTQKPSWYKSLFKHLTTDKFLFVEFVVLFAVLVISGFFGHQYLQNVNKVNQPVKPVPHIVAKSSTSPTPAPTVAKLAPTPAQTPRPTPVPACASITPDSYPWTYGNSTDCSFSHAAGSLTVSYATTGYNSTNSSGDQFNWFPTIVCSPQEDCTATHQPNSNSMEVTISSPVTVNVWAPNYADYQYCGDTMGNCYNQVQFSSSGFSFQDWDHLVINYKYQCTWQGSIDQPTGCTQ